MVLDPDPDPYSQYGAGSGSRRAISIRIHMDPDPDPKHWLKHNRSLFQGDVEPCVNCDNSPSKERDGSSSPPPVPHSPAQPSSRDTVKENLVEADDRPLCSQTREKSSPGPGVAPLSLPLRPPKEEGEALLELERSVSRDSLQSGAHSSEPVDTGSEGGSYIVRGVNWVAFPGLFSRIQIRTFYQPQFRAEIKDLIHES